MTIFSFDSGLSAVSGDKNLVFSTEFALDLGGFVLLVLDVI